MDCREFKRDAFEIVVGAPGDRRKAAFEQHAESCDACRAFAADIQSLRKTLQSGWQQPSASPALRRQVRDALSRTSTAPNATEPTRAAPVAPARQAASRRVSARSHRKSPMIFVPLSLAALIIVAIAAWQFFMPQTAARPVVSVVKHEILYEAMRRHVWCSREEHVFHQDADLSDDQPQTAKTLSQELGLQVRVPEFTSFGYSFVGARRCRVAGIPVAHALYYSAQDRLMVSLFSMYRIHDLGDPGAKGRYYFILGEGSGTTLAWNEGRQTYVLSGQLSRADALAMGESLRGTADVAGIDLDESGSRFLATYRPALAARFPVMLPQTPSAKDGLVVACCAVN